MATLDFKALFEKSHRVRHMESKREFDCVKVDEPFESPCPDKFATRDVERTIEEKKVEWDIKTNSIKRTITPRVVTDTMKVIDQAEGHYRGGTVKGKAGDFLLFDGETFFVVKHRDERGVPVFDKEYMKL